MLKFSVGTPVKFRQDLNVGFRYGGIKWIASTDHLKGEYATISRTNPSENTYMIEGVYWWFEESMFEDRPAWFKEGEMDLARKRTNQTPEDAESIEELKQEVRYLREELKEMKQLMKEFIENDKPQQEGTNRKAIHIK